MEQTELKELLSNLQLDKNITLQDIPEIDLYMDQVIQLFENNFSDTVKNKDDKVLTKTMINNYAKDKLLMPIENKKYSKEHIILLSLIYQLKGSLSINDIKKVFAQAVNSFGTKDSFPLRDFYEYYLNLAKINLDEFEVEILKKLDDVNSNKQLDKDEFGKYEKSLLLIISLVNMSNLYRRTSEKLIDELLKSTKEIQQK